MVTVNRNAQNINMLHVTLWTCMSTYPTPALRQPQGSTGLECGFRMFIMSTHAVQHRYCAVVLHAEVTSVIEFVGSVLHIV